MNQYSGMSNPIGRLPTSDEFSKYLQCLNNPFDCGPARSGVDCALPTGVFTLYSRQIINTSSTGSIGLIGHPRVFNALYASGSTGNPYTYTINLTSFPQTTGVQAIYTKGRVISAGIRIRPMQPSTADQGQIAMVVLPGETELEATGVVPYDALTNPYSWGWNEVLQHPNASVYPFRRGGTVIWRPQDPNSFVFTQGIINKNGVTDVVDTAQSIPYFAIAIANTAASATFEIEYVTHIEGVIGTTYSGVVAVQPTLHSLPSSVAMNAVKSIQGPALTKSSFVGTLGGITENRATAGSTPQVGTAKKGGFDWGKFATDVLSFGASVLPMIL